MDTKLSNEEIERIGQMIRLLENKGWDILLWTEQLEDWVNEDSGLSSVNGDDEEDGYDAEFDGDGIDLDDEDMDEEDGYDAEFDGDEEYELIENKP